MMGNPTAKDEMPLQTQVTLEPFEKWGMHFIGPIHPPSGKKERQHCVHCSVPSWCDNFDDS